MLVLWSWATSMPTMVRPSMVMTHTFSVHRQLASAKPVGSESRQDGEGQRQSEATRRGPTVNVSVESRHLESRRPICSVSKVDEMVTGSDCWATDIRPERRRAQRTKIPARNRGKKSSSNLELYEQNSK